MIGRTLTVFYPVVCYNAVLGCHCSDSVTEAIIAKIVFNGYVVGVPVHIYTHRIKPRTCCIYIINDIVSADRIFTCDIHNTALTVNPAALRCDSCLINKVSVHGAIHTAHDIHTYLTDMMNGIAVYMDIRNLFACRAVIIVIVGNCSACNYTDTSEVTDIVFENMYAGKTFFDSTVPSANTYAVCVRVRVGIFAAEIIGTKNIVDDINVVITFFSCHSDTVTYAGHARSVVCGT